MNEQHIAWIAGLFEGEGTFSTVTTTLRLSITSTDRDVLERVVSFGGGKIYKQNRYKNFKEHWKDVYIWVIFGKHAYDLCLRILPFLLSRRKKKAEEWLKEYENRRLRERERADKKCKTDAFVLKLLKEGFKHREIAKKLGVERSAVSHRLKRINGVCSA